MKWLPREKFTPDVPGSLVKNFDPVGLVLLGLIVLGIMWPFLSASGEAHNPNAGTPPYWLLAVSAALVVVLILWEAFWRKTGASALLQPSLYKSPSFVLGLTATFFYFGGFTSIFLVITLYLQQGRGWSALTAGLAAVPFAVVSGAASGVSGQLVNHFGRTIPLLGASIATLGMLGVAASAHGLPPSVAPVGIILCFAFAGLGSGLFISTNQALTLEGVEAQSAGLAAALMQTFQRLGAAIGLSVITTKGGSGAAHEEASASALVVASVAIAVAIALAVLANIVDAVRRGSSSPHKAQVAKILQSKPGDLD